MSKFICSACGYTHEGNEAPRRCPLCKSPSSVFKLDNADQDDAQSLEHSVNAKENFVEEEITQEQVKNPNFSADNKGEDANIDSIQKDECCSKDDENEILKFGNAKLQAVKWYKETHNCGLKEAKDVVDAVFEKHGIITSTGGENDDTFPLLNNDSYDNNTGKSSKKSCLIIIGVLVLLFIIGGLLNNSPESKQKDAIADRDSISIVDSVENDIKSPEYIKKCFEETINQAIKEDVDRALTKYFTKDFITLYKEVEDFDNKFIEPGCLGFWDFDFWTGGQEGELQNVKVLKVNKTNEYKAEVIVQYLIKFGDYDESKVSEEFMLLFESGEWKIDDFNGYKFRFKNYIETSVNQHAEEVNELIADTSLIAE